MSIANCHKCGCMVDTDAEPECYFLEHDDGSEEELDYCLCASCREDVIEQRANRRNKP